MSLLSRLKASPAVRVASVIAMLIGAAGLLVRHNLVPTRDTPLPHSVGPVSTTLATLEHENSLTEDAIGYEANGVRTMFAHHVDERDASAVAQQAREECGGPSTTTTKDNQILVRCGKADNRSATERALQHAAGRSTFIGRSDDGKTRVLTFDEANPVDVRKLFPKGGVDAPGSDSRTLPRPDHSVRLYSGLIQNSGSAVRIYNTEAPFDVAEKDMRQKMESKQWTRVANEDKGVLLYINGAHSAIIQITPQESPAKGSLVTLIELGTEQRYGK